MRKKLLPLGRLFESAWYNPILKAVPMSMGILMSGIMPGMQLPEI